MEITTEDKPANNFKNHVTTWKDKDIENLSAEEHITATEESIDLALYWYEKCQEYKSAYQSWRDNYHTLEKKKAGLLAYWYVWVIIFAMGGMVGFFISELIKISLLAK